MEFRSGMLAVVLIVISLIASAGLGVVLNVDSKTITVEEPVFKSDITGLYQADKQETFIQNDVAANFNGYSWGDSTQYPVDFIPAGNANNYPLTITREGPRNMDPFDDLSSVSNIPFPTGRPGYRYIMYDPTNLTMGGTAEQYNATPPETVRVIRLSDAISEFLPSDTTDLKSIRLSVSVTKISQTITVEGEYEVELVYPDSLTAIAPSGYFYTGGSGLIQIRPYVYTPYKYSGMAVGDSRVSCVVEYFVDSGKCEIYNREYNPANLLDTKDAADVYIYSQSVIKDIKGTMNYQGTTTEYTVENVNINVPNNNIHVEYVFDSGTRYVDPRYGVANVYGNTTPITWVNGYSNQRLDLLLNMSINTDLIEDYEGDARTEIDTTANYQNEWTFYYGMRGTALTDPTFILRAESPGNGRIVLSVYNNASTPQLLGSLDLGSGWVGANIRYDGRLGTISAQPIGPSSWGNFLEWSSEQPYQIVSNIPTGKMYGFTVNNPSTTDYSYRWQISNTYVSLNTYGVIMIDPVVNIRNWYPNNDEYMLSFTKTAATGNSITIGGIPYEVVSNEIDVDGVKIDITDYTITYIKNEDTFDITIYSNKSRSEAKVQSTDTEISMQGAWYFNSSYYVIEEVDKEVFDWKFGELAFGFNALFLFMGGFLLLGTIAIWKLIPGMLTALDIGIVIIAEIILFFIAG